MKKTIGFLLIVGFSLFSQAGGWGVRKSGSQWHSLMRTIPIVSDSTSIVVQGGDSAFYEITNLNCFSDTGGTINLQTIAGLKFFSHTVPTTTTGGGIKMTEIGMIRNGFKAYSAGGPMACSFTWVAR